MTIRIDRRRLLRAVWLAALSVAAVRPGQPSPTDARISAGQVLARAYCQICHLEPDPSSLDKATWEKHALPWMTTKLGLKKVDFEKLPGGQSVREANILPQQPMLSSNQWEAICRYYIANAPEKPIPQPPRPEIQMDAEKFFGVERAPFQQPTPMTTLLQVVPRQRLLFAGDSRQRALYLLDDKGTELSRYPVGLPPVAVELDSAGLYVTLIGYVAPSDDPLGRLLFIPNGPEGFEKPRLLLDRLQRPCVTRIHDLNGDGREDLVISQHGNLLGRFSWYEQLADGAFREHVLRSKPGALSSYVRDFNQDGLPDLVVLATQADESIFLFTNQGDGKFKQLTLLQQPPAWGSTYFEPSDFNGDGLLDLLVANGDNAEYPAPMKHYHGVRIYLNEGKHKFRQAWFFPLNGAYKAVARDFDADGDLDIAAISFFPDYLKSPEESFVLLRNLGNLQFTAHSFPASSSGRWLVMDAGDLDADGDEDIVLGAFNRGPQTIPIPDSIRAQWRTGPSLMILRNRAR